MPGEISDGANEMVLSPLFQSDLAADSPAVNDPGRPILRIGSFGQETWRKSPEDHGDQAGLGKNANFHPLRQEFLRPSRDKRENQGGRMQDQPIENQAYADTHTIPQYVAENPDTDVTSLHESLWGILTEVKERVSTRFPVTRHPAAAGREFYTEGPWEGSLNTWTGQEVEWLVHSWIGNRRQSILDMNVNIWLGPWTDVPHLSFVFGTIPQIFHYADLIPRRDLVADADYVHRYYEPLNETFLRLRADPLFQASVSHGTYCRAVLSPVAVSLTAKPEAGPEQTIPVLRRHVMKTLDTWLEMVDRAAPLPAEERAAMQHRDHYVRRSIYQLDPMNKLAEKFLGKDMTETLVNLRYGKEQMAEIRH